MTSHIQMIVTWRTLDEKKPEKERTYAITVQDIFGPMVIHAKWWRGHFWRFGNIIDTEVMAWADGLRPYGEKRKRHEK
ncbi:MAG: hypothetical protein IIZ34_05755 [Eubacterium sp.]|nr:hypothetical protein [Eubacterium sp.]